MIATPPTYLSVIVIKRSICPFSRIKVLPCQISLTSVQWFSRKRVAYRQSSFVWENLYLTLLKYILLLLLFFLIYTITMAGYPRKVFRKGNHKASSLRSWQTYYKIRHPCNEHCILNWSPHGISCCNESMLNWNTMGPYPCTWLEKGQINF